ncbi:MAG: phosphoadenosine phosphosulfate reductase family protein [Desulfurococcales archaeon]|nr:phosphoadenosine phosphosulfate reductase family protein [Desulfurococcales archaeon]
MGLKILVRGRKDASAVKHAVRAIQKDPYITVESLGGVRGDKLCDLAHERAEPLTIVLLDRSAPPNCVVRKPLVETVRSSASKIRNLPLQSIVSLISRGRAGLRIRYSWYKGSILMSAHVGEPLESLEVTPEGDSFLLYSRGIEMVSRLTGIPSRVSPGEVAVLIKAGGGSHMLYGGREPSVKMRFARDSTKPVVEYSNPPITGLSLDALLETNSGVLRELERISLEMLSREVRGRAVVPLSGGKDSSAALILAVKALGPDRVTAVYVDTGIDFDENREYAERLASRLGVELLTERADVDRGLIIERLPLPTAKNRWCTGRKLAALHRAIRRVASSARITIVVGDRDAESSKRSLRPPVRLDESLNLPVVAPLKYWAGAHVETYLHLEGVEPNPLYLMGFLRLGCYLCFALRPSWELQLLLHSGYYKRVLRDKPEQAQLIKRFLGATLGEGLSSGRGEKARANN